MKSNIFLIFGLLLLSCSCQKSENISASIPTDAITKLYVQDAYDFFDARPLDSRKIKPEIYTAVGYHVKLKYPAESIISFYKEKLKELGYQPYLESKWTNGKYEWQVFVDERNKLAPCHYQYLADWVNKDKSRIINLVIEYRSSLLNGRYDCAELPNNDMAQVAIVSESYEWRIK
jgi:hypothetical protein